MIFCSTVVAVNECAVNLACVGKQQRHLNLHHDAAEDAVSEVDMMEGRVVCVSPVLCSCVARLVPGLAWKLMHRRFRQNYDIIGANATSW